jgi:hypothetical protein
MPGTPPSDNTMNIPETTQGTTGATSEAIQLPASQLVTRRNAVLGLVLTGLSLVLPGCGGGTRGDEQAGDDERPAEGTVVGPSGGTVRTSDGGVEMVVPAGLLAGEVRFTLEATGTPEPVAALFSRTHGGALMVRVVTGGRVAWSPIEVRGRSRSTRQQQDDGEYLTFFTAAPSGYVAGRTVAVVHRYDAPPSPYFAPPASIPFPVDSVYEPSTDRVRVTVPRALISSPIGSRGPFQIQAPFTINFVDPNSFRSQKTPKPFEKVTFNGTNSIVDDWAGVNALSPQDLRGRRIAVLVPGTWADTRDMLELRRFLWELPLPPHDEGSQNATPQRFFDDVIGIHCDTTLVGPETNGTSLANALRPLLDAGARVSVFAWSQGGLIARWAIEKAGAAGCVMLVMFGTPNDGVPYNPARLAAWFRESELEDPGVKAMTYERLSGRRSEFLRLLNDAPTPGSAAYYTVSGQVDDWEFNRGDRFPYFFTTWGLYGGVDDGVVYEDNVRLVRLGGLARYCRAYDAEHNLTVSANHTTITDVITNSNIGERLRGWIYREGLGDTNVTVY